MAGICILYLYLLFILIQEFTLYNSAYQSLIGDDDYLRELDYYLGDISSPLFKSFLDAIRAKSVMMKLCDRWEDEDEARIRHLLKVWSLKFLEKTFVPGTAYGYGPLQIVCNDSNSFDLGIRISSIGENIPMGGCVIVSSAGEAPSLSEKLPQSRGLTQKNIVIDFDDYQEEISGLISASDLMNASIDTSSLTVTFYGYDFAWYDGKMFNGVVLSHFL